MVKKEDVRRRSLSPWQFRVNEQTGCWEWLRSKLLGYGMYKIQGYGRAHRFYYFKLVGEIPKGLTIDHLCRNKSCVNPYHLEPTTDRENILRGNCPAAINARKKFCKYGHRFTKKNTKIWNGFYRSCWICTTKVGSYAYKKEKGWISTGKARPKVAQIMGDKIIRIFKSQREAVLATGLSQGNMSMALRGNRSLCGGYKWKYIHQHPELLTAKGESHE